MADTNGLGYENGALVFGTGLALLALVYFYTNVSHTFLFWAAFILTRPLGATLGDLLDKPINQGGLSVSRFLVSAILVAIMIACILIFPQGPVLIRARDGRLKRSRGCKFLFSLFGGG
jgi:uncharacterized membrane-anchored protein